MDWIHALSWCQGGKEMGSRKNFQQSARMAEKLIILKCSRGIRECLLDYSLFIMFEISLK